MEQAGPFRALGHWFVVRTQLPGASEVVSRLFSPFADPDHDGPAAAYVLRRTGGDTPYEILFEQERLAGGIDVGNLFDWLITDVGRRALASPHPYIAIHSGVVSHAGGGILMPAPQDHGKSTLTAALVRAGCAFLSDEAALIDPETLQVRPFPRPILLSPASVSLFPGLEEAIPASEAAFRNYQFHLTADDLRPGSLGEPCSVELIIAPVYEPGTGAELEPLSRSEALVLAVSQCLNGERFGARAIRILGSIVERARCYRLRMGDITSSSDAVLALADRAIDMGLSGSAADHEIDV